MNEDGFSNVVEASWGNMVYNGSVDIVLKNKLKNLRKDIKDWWNIRSKLNLIDQKERDSLKQKSRVKWAVEGDENTKFFHSIVNKKIKNRSNNRINLNGAWNEDLNEIQEAARNHFASRFKELNSNRPLFRSNLFMKLDDSDVSFLESEFTLEEVKEAFGCLARGCNASFIVLIPKNSDPVDLGDYRPISLIGCMYKVLSKLLSRRLCKVIHKLIRPNQTTFLSGRQILDGILIANEIVNYAKKEKLKLLIFKVDFEKAFDSVNWKFLIDIMSQMGFSAKWCKLIHACLSSASISVLINGSPSKEFSMKRGLRQGDPLHPVGKDMRKIEAWDEVVNHFSKRLSMWKAMLLSVGGRLTLVKAVLGSLPLYFFSVFKAPKAMLSGVKLSQKFMARKKASISLCSLIQKKMLVSYVDSHKFVLNSWVPRKVNVCAWRVALDHLPTRENLSRRGLLHLDSSSCLFYESEVETKGHYNILHGIPSLYANKWKAKLFHAICLGFIWSVWAWRNRILHASSDEEKSCALHEDIFPAVQRILLLWTSNRAPKNRFSWANWILRPNELLDS
ncbi:RNA-directed DNA polymerase, eukaryota [Tanacetum coccineum]